MKLDEFSSQLEESEKFEYASLVSEAQTEGADPKTIRGKLARLASSVLKRLGEQPNPGPIIGEFSKAYFTMPKKQEALPFDELCRRFPYPLSYELKRFLDEKKLFDSGENAPQYAYDCCAVMGLLVRLAATIGIQEYVKTIGGKDAGLNREIIETLRTPADGSWLALARNLAKRISKEKNPGLAGVLQQALSTKVSLQGSKGSTTPTQALEKLVSFRNRLIHGDRSAKNDLKDVVVLLLTSIRGFGFLAEFDLMVRQDEGGFKLNGLLPEKIQKVNPAVPNNQPCLVSQKDPKDFLSLFPIIHFQEGKDGNEVNFDEIAIFMTLYNETITFEGSGQPKWHWTRPVGRSGQSKFERP